VNCPADESACAPRNCRATRDASRSFAHLHRARFLPAPFLATPRRGTDAKDSGAIPSAHTSPLSCRRRMKMDVLVEDWHLDMVFTCLPPALVWDMFYLDSCGRLALSHRRIKMDVLVGSCGCDPAP
jgi:hypothetical protein